MNDSWIMVSLFLNTLSSNDLLSHSTSAPSPMDITLDLVITTNYNVSIISVSHIQISNHHLLCFQHIPTSTSTTTIILSHWAWLSTLPPFQTLTMFSFPSLHSLNTILYCIPTPLHTLSNPLSFSPSVIMMGKPITLHLFCAILGSWTWLKKNRTMTTHLIFKVLYKAWSWPLVLFCNLTTFLWTLPLSKKIKSNWFFF